MVGSHFDSANQLLMTSTLIGTLISKVDPVDINAQTSATAVRMKAGDRHSRISASKTNRIEKLTTVYTQGIGSKNCLSIALVVSTNDGAGSVASAGVIKTQKSHSKPDTIPIAT